MSKPLVDAADRRSIRTELERNILVEAAAGTGKTTELVNRIVAVIAEGKARVDRLVAVTFTEKAAGELKLRVRAEIERARHAKGATATRRKRLDEALARLEEARVGTIHGFCADLLRERAIEAHVDPRFRVMTEPEATRLHAEAFQLWLQETLEDPPEGVRRSLRRSSYEGPVDRLRSAAQTLVEWRDFPAAWRRDPFPREQRLDALVERLHTHAERTDNCHDRKHRLHAETEPVRRLSRAIRAAEEVRERDYDGLEGELTGLLDYRFEHPARGRGGAYGPGLSRDQLYEEHVAFAREVKQFAQEADADLAALLHGELAEVSERYATLKESRGLLDFVDLLLRVRELIQRRADVRGEFQRRFTHIFVDEFQDTDPLQAEILLLLAGGDPAIDDWREVDPVPGKLFLVADPKQSIYRFRRADVGTYFEVRDALARRGTLQLQLRTNFRTLPSIQNAVNRAFAPLMDGDREMLQAEYVPLAGVREEIQGQPSVVALPVPRPHGMYQVANASIEASQPAAVGAFIGWLLTESGWKVTTRESPKTALPIEARHICILFRRLTGWSGDITRPYVRELENRGIRHLLVGGRSFHAREEVETIRAALTAIEWPDDELSVYATLRGSLFGIGDAELLEFRQLHARRLHPFRGPREGLAERLRPIAEGLMALQELHRQRNRRPVAETIHDLLERTRAHAAFALRPSGEQVLANVLHLADEARSYEGAGGISFRGFVERLIEEADGPGSSQAPILEDGSDGVRLMTVHKAKGLEFPVVILADMPARLVRDSADRVIDPDRRLCASRIARWSPAELREREPEEIGRDRAEGVRLTYVAATRARDLLVVPTIGTGPRAASWVQPLDGAIYPPEERWSSGAEAPGCPAFGDETVLDLPDPRRGQVKPGLYYRVKEQFGVVWWDPEALLLDVPERVGVRETSLIEASDDPETEEQDARVHRDWRRAREAAIADSSRPSREIVRATATAKESEPGAVPSAEVDVQVIELPIDPDRPGGRRFGALVHAILGTVPLDADPEQVAAFARLHARTLGAEEAEATAAAKAAVQVLSHDLLQRTRRAADRGGCRREIPLTLRGDDGAIVDGVADLAFEEDGSWVVVEFKTDRELSRALESYRRQAAIYGRAIALATGKPASAFLLRV